MLNLSNGCLPLLSIEVVSHRSTSFKNNYTHCDLTMKRSSKNDLCEIGLRLIVLPKVIQENAKLQEL